MKRRIDWNAVGLWLLDLYGWVVIAGVILATVGRLAGWW